MDVQTVFDDVTSQNPVFAEDLVESLMKFYAIGFLPALVEQIKNDLVESLTMADEDEVYLQRIREARWQIGVLETIQDQLGSLQIKDKDNE